jgi:uncharacterized integral membrane protein
MAEPETPQPAKQNDRAGKKPWQGSGPGGFSWKAIFLAALGIYAILLIIRNSNTVSVDFVFFSTHTRLIWLVLLSMALGALIMSLVPSWRRRRQATHAKDASGQPDKKFWQGSGPGGLSWKAIVGGALGIYGLLLIIMNSKTVTVDFVFLSTQTREIWLVLLGMALGALIVWLVPRWRKRHQAEHHTAPATS